MGKGGSWRCESCEKGFRSLSAFDMHRTGEYRRRNHTRRCLSTAEMQARGMRLADNGAWVTGVEYPTEIQRSA